MRPTRVGSVPTARNGVGSSATSTAGAPASSSKARSGDRGRSNSALMAKECPVYTGSRTHSADTASAGRPRILRLSSRSFCSSTVSPLPSSTSAPARGTTLKATGAGNTVGAGLRTALPSKAKPAEASAPLRSCSSSSAMPARPLPDTAW